MNSCYYIEEIRKRYGNVRRARGCWLYTEKNVRLLDMFLDGGCAVLGRRRGRAKLALKNALDKGLSGGLPSSDERALTRAARSLLGCKSGEAVLFRSQAEAETACRALGLKPLRWLPWLLGNAPAGYAAMAEPMVEDAALIFPAPFPFGGSPDFTGCIAFFAEPCAAAAVATLPSYLPPPPLLAAVVRSLYDLRLELPRFADADFAKLMSFPDGAASIEGVTLMRCGAWLFASVEGANDGEDAGAGLEERMSRYRKFFLRSLEAGVLVSPYPDVPSIIPLAAASSPQEGKAVASAMGMLSLRG